MSTQTRGVSLRALGILPAGGLGTLSAKRARLPGPPHRTTKIPAEQVLEILRLSEEFKTPDAVIARTLGLPIKQVRSVTYGGVGTRTIYLRRRVQI